MRRGAPPIAVCIAGMHRSGTSMVARLLNRCGLSLGPEKELLPAAADNPEGFWENRRFLAVNEFLLAGLGGTWARPPRFVPGWEEAAKLAPVVAHARKLVASFPSDVSWGWKDPVNTLTLPFWRRVVPDLAVVVCLRHPLDVAASLSARHRCSREVGLELWQRYAKQLLAEGPERRIVTHYDSYFTSGAGELRRVVDALGLRVTNATIAKALTTLRRPLRHHQVALTQAPLSPEVAIPYATLCGEAGVAADIRSASAPRAAARPSARLARPLPSPSATR